MNPKTILDIFRKLKYIRLVEETIAELYKEQQMRCPVHLSIGQEAVSVGICANLLREDQIFSNHRSHAHYLAKGGDLKAFFSEIYGKANSCSKGRGGSMHLVDLSIGFMGSTPIVGGLIPVAVGAAFASSYKKSGNIAVSFMGDGATEEGIFHESLNFAKLKNLPVLFVCENNFYSVYTPLALRQPKRRITDIARAHGLDCYECDGNDALQIYETSKKAINNIRNDKGPAFIELATYRWKEHCGPNYDNHLGYRPENEFAQWKSKDPVKIMEEIMIKQKILTEEEIKKIEEETKNMIALAVNFAKSSKFPEKEDLGKYVYMD